MKPTYSEEYFVYDNPNDQGRIANGLTGSFYKIKRFWVGRVFQTEKVFVRKAILDLAA